MKNLFMTFLLFFMVGITIAQKKDLSELSSATVKYIKPIQYNDTLAGYYILSELDVTSKTESSYSISIFDQDLNIIKEIDFTMDINAVLAAVDFNGKVFCITYTLQGKNVIATKSDLTLDIIYFEFIDLEGTKKTLKKSFKKNENRFHMTSSTETHLATPVKNKGFVISFNSLIEVYNNTAELQWSKDGNYAFQKCVGEYILIRKNNSDDYNESTFQFDLIVYTYSNGNEPIYTMERSTLGTNYYHVYDFIIDNKELYLILGELEMETASKKPYANSMRNPKRYLIVSYDLVSKNTKEISVPGDFKEAYSNKFVTKQKINIYVERFIVSKIFIQGGNMNFIGVKFLENKPVEIGCYQYNLSNNEIKSKYFPTSKEIESSIMSVFIGNTLGYFNGQLDSQPSPFGRPLNTDGLNFCRELTLSDNSFMHLFFQANKTKSGKTETGMPTQKLVSYTLSALYSTSSELNYSSLPMFELESEYCQILPAKPGYVCIFEYFEKEKKIDFRLEKFDF